MTDKFQEAIDIVYIDLIFKHHEAWRKHGVNSSERKKYFKLLELILKEYPESLAHWTKKED